MFSSIVFIIAAAAPTAIGGVYFSDAWGRILGAGYVPDLPVAEPAYAGAMAVDGNGYLYIAVGGDALTKSTYTDSFVLRTNFAAGAMTFDASGNLYSATDSAINRLTPQGDLSTYLDHGAAGLAFDGLSNLFFSSGTSVYKVTPSGTLSLFAGLLGTANVSGLVIDKSGTLFTTASLGIEKVGLTGETSLMMRWEDAASDGWVFTAGGAMAISDEDDLFYSYISYGGHNHIAIAEIPHGTTGSGSVVTGDFGGRPVFAYTPFPPVPFVMPEPSTTAFFALGLTLLFWQRQRPQTREQKFKA